MHYIPTTGWEDGIAELAKCLIDELSAGQKVLWLLSGGSNITASVKVMDCITAENSKNLTIGQIDERYGPIGHSDSNWAQLLKAGLDTKEAQVLPILIGGLDLSSTANSYGKTLQQNWGKHDKVLMQLGIGNDGHVAGILPYSVAVSEKTQLVTSYIGNDFERITISPVAFEQKATAVVFAFGVAKHEAVHNLQHLDLAVDEQPAQLLKLLTNVYFYSDQLGE